MKYSQHGLSMTQHFEQCLLQAYQDTGGVWTIGWGHTGSDVDKGIQITQEHADEILLHDVQFAEDAVNELVLVELNQNEFDALVDFVFNIGRHAFEESTILRLLNDGEFDLAADQFDRWIYDNGKKIKGLIRRRNDNEELFETPEGEHHEIG